MTTTTITLLILVFVAILFAQDRYYRWRIGRVFDKLDEAEKERDEAKAQLAGCDDWDDDDDFDGDYPEGETKNYIDDDEMDALLRLTDTPEDQEAMLRWSQ